VRTSWLLVSIAVHGAAITAAVGWGAYPTPSTPSPPAYIELQQQVASAPATTQLVPTPVVTVEDLIDEMAIHELDVSKQDVLEQPEDPAELVAEPALTDEIIVPAPSEIMGQVTLDRVRRKPPAPVVVTPIVVASAPQPTVVPPAAQPQPDVEAQRSDNQPPTYPEKERRLAREGKVVVRVAIDEHGAVENVELHAPSRYAGFNRAALEAARKWNFTPAIQGGVAVASVTDVEVVFRLTSDE